MRMGMTMGMGARPRIAQVEAAAPFDLLTYLEDESATAFFDFGDTNFITKDGSNNVTAMANKLALDIQLLQNGGTAGVWSADCKGTGVGGVDFALSRYHARNEADSADVVMSSLITASTFLIGVAYYADAGIATSGKAHGTILSTEGVNNHVGMVVSDTTGTIVHHNHARVDSLDAIYNEVTVALSTLNVVLFKKTGGQMYTSVNGGAWSTPTAGGDVSVVTTQLWVGTSGISPGFQYFNGGIFKMFFSKTIPADLDAQLANIDAAMRE